MKPALRSKLGKCLLLAVAILGVSLWLVSCRNGEPAIPPLTGPSGHRLFLTMEATPEHLLIVNSNQPRQISHVSAQLKNQLGQGVVGEHIRIKILNADGVEAAIGSFAGTTSCNGGGIAECTTDSGGFVRVDYVAPTKVEEPASVFIYIWAFMTNPAYVFEVTDKHELELELGGVPPPAGNCGANGLNPTFTFSPAAPVVGNAVCFDSTTSTSTSPVIAIKWDFGDGHGDNTNNPTPCHTYSSAGQFFATLTMTDSNSDRCSSTQPVPVTSGLPPVCGTTVINPATPNVGDTVTFTSLATDPDSPIRNYSWNFGDGSGTTTRKSNSVTHRYTSPGTFTVILTITDTQGNVTTCTLTVTVATTAPTCSFTATPNTGSSPLPVAFDASGSSGFGTLTYAWDFGDGGLGSGVSPGHTFIAAGTPAVTTVFNVTLTVTDGAGTTASCTNSVTATVP